MYRKHNFIFLRFASTYILLIIIVLLCLFPVFNGMIRLEEEKVMQRVLDQADAAITANAKTSEQLFTLTRSFYNDPKLVEVYYSSTRTENEPIFYSMTQLHSRMSLYYQNLDSFANVLLYLPKLDYVLTKDYIFRTREDYYASQQSSHYGRSDWLQTLSDQGKAISIYPDAVTDQVRSGKQKEVLNYAYTFPQIGDANIRILALISLTSDALAKDLLVGEVASCAFALVGDSDGRLLSSYQWGGEPQMPTGEAWIGQEGEVYRLIHLYPDSAQPVCIGIQEAFFSRQKYTAALMLCKSISFALVFGAAFALFFAYYRSRPIEQILGLLRASHKSHTSNPWLEIESSLTGMTSEINQCKQTIEELEQMVKHELLEKFYTGRLTQHQMETAFLQAFGAMPEVFKAVLFNCLEGSSDQLEPLLLESMNGAAEQLLFLHNRKNRLYALFNPELLPIEQLEQALTHIRTTADIAVKAGVSDASHHPEEVRQSIQEAAQRLKTVQSIPNIYILTRSISASLPPSFVQTQELDSLHRALAQGNGKAADKIIVGIFNRVQAMHFDQLDLRQLFFSLSTVYTNAANELVRYLEAVGHQGVSFDYLPSDLDEYGLEAVKCTFLDLNQKLAELHKQQQAESADMRASNLVRYIEQNFSDPNLCASSLADHFHLSEKYVFRLVKNACGKPLNNYLSALRIDTAVELLENSDLSVSEIAVKVGLSSSNTMYKVFMRVKGGPPSSYRKNALH